jgi:microcystin-dependent protein
MIIKYKKIKLLALVLFFGVSTSYAQVSIGDRPTPDSAAILDLRNTSDLGLLLPTATVNPGALDDADVIPLGMLYYYEGNLFLKDSINTSSPTDDFTGVTPWKSIFTGVKPVNVYFNPTGYTGVGIGIDGSDNLNIKANLHVAKDGTVVKEVNVGATSASFLIGDSDADIHMELDNDEILVKTNTNTAGTLKLQEGGGTVQVGESATIRSTLNVFGEVQQHGFALVPAGGIIMWSELGGVGVPPGWALCDGGLKTKLDGTTFTAPDLRERFIVGAGGENTTNPVVGAAYTNGVGTDGGRNEITLTQAQMPSHTHTINQTPHSHKQSSSYGWTTLPAAAGFTDENPDSQNFQDRYSNTSSETINISNNSTGSSQAHENRPPYYALAFIIKL